jgi:hypothetical protein
MDVLRRFRVFVGIGNRHLVAQPIWVGFLDRSGLLNRRSAMTRAWDGNFRRKRHDNGILSIWQVHVADLLGRLVSIRRHGVGFLTRWALCVGWWFWDIGHHVSPENTYKPMNGEACSHEDPIAYPASTGHQK